MSSLTPSRLRFAPQWPLRIVSDSHPKPDTGQGAWSSPGGCGTITLALWGDLVSALKPTVLGDNRTGVTLAGVRGGMTGRRQPGFPPQPCRPPAGEAGGAVGPPFSSVLSLRTDARLQPEFFRALLSLSR